MGVGGGQLTPSAVHTSKSNIHGLGSLSASSTPSPARTTYVYLLMWLVPLPQDKTIPDGEAEPLSSLTAIQTLPFAKVPFGELLSPETPLHKITSQSLCWACSLHPLVSAFQALELQDDLTCYSVGSED